MYIGSTSQIGALGDEQSEDLLHRLKAQDPQAIAELYDRYGRLLYTIIFRIVNNPGVAEDLVQETFLKAWNRAAGLNEDYGSVGPWLLSIARHCALDYKKSSHARLTSQVEMDDNSFPPMTIENDLLCSDQGRLLTHAFQRLSPNQRQIIEMAYYEGLSQTSIAERLKQPLGTIKS